MIIAFSGVDGSGKSTQASFVAQLFVEQGLRVHYLHMIHWSLVNQIGQLIENVKRDEKAREVRNAPGSSNSFEALGRFLVAVIDLIRFRLFAFYHIKLGGKILICDRYFLDLAVHSVYRGLMNETLENVYCWLAPKSTMTLLLDIPGEIAQQREREHPTEYYFEKRELYLARANSWQATVVPVGELGQTHRIIRDTLSSLLPTPEPEVTGRSTKTK